MKSFLIGYDLYRPEQDYADLISAIKALGLWWHCLDSTWIVRSGLAAPEIRDLLGAHIDSNDELLVVTLTGEGAWTGFNQECSQWLKSNL